MAFSLATPGLTAPSVGDVDVGSTQGRQLGWEPISPSRAPTAVIVVPHESGKQTKQLNFINIIYRAFEI